MSGAAEAATAGAPRGGRAATTVVWAGAAIASAVIVVLAYSGTMSWFGESSPGGVYGALGVVLAASVLASLGLQLAVGQSAGFVGRASAAITGAVLVVAVASLAVLPVALA